MMPDSQSEQHMSARSIADGLSCWTGPVDPQPLDGGYTNTNFVVTHNSAKYVVRIGDDIPEHGVVRSHEVKVCRAAYACGLSPEVVHHEPGALVMRFIEARTLSPQDIRDPPMMSRIVEIIRRCHTEMPNQLRGATLMFWVFQVCRNYIAISGESTCRLESRLGDLALMNTDLEERLGPIRPSFCHNDLLPANFLDDGERLWLLDWEYAGWNTPFFDLANLSSNAQMTEAQRHQMLAIYFNRQIDVSDLTKLQVAECASLLRESLWSIVQETHSSLDIDYETYTDDYLARLDAAYETLVGAG